MTLFIQAQSRSQCTLFPESGDDFIAEDNPVRVIDVFVDESNLGSLGFYGAEPERTGRPAYHPSTLLKIYVYGGYRYVHPLATVLAHATPEYFGQRGRNGK